jgi:arylsulfatase
MPGDEAWRVIGQRFSGNALPVWPGEAIERTVIALPSASSLRFATCLEPAVSATDFDAGEVRFRVELDGETIFEHEHADPHAESFAWHEVALPERGGRRSRLRFAVEGPLAYSSFFEPVIGPARVNRYDDRPWGEGRPNIVIFLADTFRADVLSFYGGALGLTPRIDELARESVRFQRARSVSTFTFPAHASMFSGLFPHQVGAIGVKRALPESILTIAEALSREGYRTAAITDSAMVSQRFGLAQGFQWFDEKLVDLDSTLERAGAFLAADDGRPVFLFVHTFRTHAPYEVSEATREAYREVLDIEGEYTELEARLKQLVGGMQELDFSGAEASEIVAQMEQHYLGGVADLDVGFGRLWDELRARGVLENGYLMFTSDHGEAFCEHGELGHKGKVWEEQIRIPMFLSGPGLQARDVELPVSLVDLPPTLAELAGIPALDEWRGRSILTLSENRPTFAFQCWGDSSEATLAVIDDDLKVISYEDPDALDEGRLMAAFDLRSDPREEQDLSGSVSDWPARLIERLGPRAADLLEAVVGPEAAQLSAEKKAELEALGYGGEER